ncbi:hypothetical protein MWU49_02280 [Alcanivorax sp. S6407]|uniref:hypothetical protein n=1 Tax=Alcanivorax sp. S6407 TaxID=2926424 RepID=UPI001FF281BC|nr:hypothetical protein [Alcanivorax sp. S6407]MCK0152518.1 hypothetical protein [Alcanivorax sp. S6407]
MERIFSQLFWLFAVLLLVSGVHAEAEQSTDPMPPASVEQAPHPCTSDGYSSWLDKTHNWMSKTVCGPSRWVDGFFVGPNDVYSDQPGTQVRVIGASRFQEHDGDNRELKVRARVELPNAQERLSLMFRNDDDTSDELRNDLDSRPEEVGENNTGYRAALRWMVNMPERMDVDLDAGVRSELTTFVRARYRYVKPIGNTLATFRFTEKVYWEDPDGFGANSLFEIDRPFTDRSTIRFASEWEKSEEFNELKRDWYFNQSASVYFRLGRQSGIGASVGFDGFTRPVSTIQTVRTSVRFRRNIWRPWFFYEVEPYVFWPREENYKGVSGIVLRLELQAGLLYD